MKVAVCIGSACHLNGSRYVVEQLQRLIEEKKLDDAVELEGRFCMGQCSRGICVTVDGNRFSIRPENTEEFFRTEIESRVKV